MRRSVDPAEVRALVRELLEERLGVARGALHASQLEIGTGPACAEDPDLPVRPACLIEPHRLCYNSGYCKKLGH